MSFTAKIRLATNSHLTLLRCEREFQLSELLQGNEDEDEGDSSPSLVFGRAWGEGVTEYLETGSLDAAVYKAFSLYCPVVENEDKGIQEEFCYHGLKMMVPKLDAIRSEWEIAEFNGKKARELAFRIHINDRMYYESALDGILRHKRDNYYACLENKHTYSWLQDLTPMYKNAAQGIAYSIVMDKMVEQPLAVIPIHYLVAQFTKSEGLHKPIFHHFKWKKSLLDRLNWFVSLGMDAERLQQMVDTGIFPMRGHSCLRFNRPCRFFGTCHLRANDRYKTQEYIDNNKSQHVKEVESNVQFVFQLDEIVKDHLDRVREELVK